MSTCASNHADSALWMRTIRSSNAGKTSARGAARRPNITARRESSSRCPALNQLCHRCAPNRATWSQAAAGGVGLFLVQLAKSMGVKNVIALASSKEKLDLVKSLGADFPSNDTEQNWVAQVEQATRGRGVEVVLEANSGEIGDKSFKLMAPFGRAVIYGAKNAHDSFPTEKVRQLILKNQSITGFNFPSLQPEQIRESCLLYWI
jgi:NADPH:quinone reductase